MSAPDGMRAQSAAPANREIHEVGQLAGLNFSDAGILPVIAQDATTGAVLMMAWANRQALTLTLETRILHYWSRSRQALWKKGETSGNLQHLISLHADCDSDTLLARVRTVGPACHTGDVTCFGALPDGDGDSGAASVAAGGGAPGTHILDELWAVLEARDAERPEGSWTTRLLTDENLRLKKLGEETVELVSAILKQDGRAAEEAADLIYHLLVSLKGANVPWRDVMEELKGRRNAGS